MRPRPPQAFVDFLYTPEAQTVFGKHGFRPEVERWRPSSTSSSRAQLFTIEDLGGWPVARPKFFDPEDGIVAEIFASSAATLE